MVICKSQELTALEGGRGTWPLFFSHRKWNTFCKKIDINFSVITTHCQIKISNKYDWAH